MRRPRVLAILNVTPDSFSDGGAHFVDGAPAVEAAQRFAWQSVRDGADAIDVGAESTRPGSDEISIEEELGRVVPVLDALGPDFPVPISIDTRRAAVAEAAAARGATILNDTAALADDPELAAVAAKYELSVVLMHRQGQPATMQDAPSYTDLNLELREFFLERVDYAISQGIARQKLFLDPGLGFGKRVEQNYQLMANLQQVGISDLPWLVGASRKSFLGVFDDRPHSERLAGSLAFAAAAQFCGAAWVRVHDVYDTVCFLKTLQSAMTGVLSHDKGAGAEGSSH